MRIHEHELGTIYVPDEHDDLSVILRAASEAAFWAADTETTGLNAFAEGFRVKIVQVGTETSAWILNPAYRRHLGVIRRLFEQGPRTWFHNWVFDAIGLEQSCGVDFDRLADRARCTDILSRLLDPRPPQKGGVGHKLEQLAPYYLDTASKKDSRTALHEAWGRANKVPIKDVFRDVPVDLAEYEIYAGQDVFLTARLARALSALVEERSELRRLASVEQPFSRRIALMQRIGMPFDNAWATRAELKFDRLRDGAERALLEDWNVDKKNAAWAHTAATSLKDMFMSMGAPLEKRTKPSKRYPDGQISLDSEVIKELSQAPGRVGELARLVGTAKRNKHYGDYIRTMRDEVGVDGRIHPNVRPMQAATARMSVSNPPVQQFPRDDVDIRGCLLADEGEWILSADYAQVEFRIGAAASQDKVMIGRIKNNEDLHAVTAAALFGPGFNESQRQASKPIGFGRLYLGGAKGIRQQMVESDTTGHVPPISNIQRAIKAFDSYYKTYNRWARRVKDEADAAGGHITTITGRPLIVDRSYAAANYHIQSAARDVFAAGITALHRRGLGDRLRLVVHDEVVLTVPPDQAEEIMREVQEAMSTVILGVPIITEAKIKGERWQK